MLKQQFPPRTRGTRARIGLVALVAAVLVSNAGCGSRASDEAIVASLRGPAAPAAAVADTQTGTDVGAPAAPTTTVPATDTPATTTTGPATTTSSSAPSVNTPAKSNAPSGGSVAKPQTATKPTVANKSPIAIGTLGAFSGVLGAVTAGSPKTIAAWVADANAHGGVNGHPVKLVVGDDQADPSTSLTLAHRLVENDKVLAFVGNIQFFGFTQVEEYLRGKNVPMVGGDFVDPGWLTSPITFPVSATVATQIVKGLKMYVDGGARHIAMLYCLEVGSLCQYLNDQAKKSEIGQYIEQSYQVSLVAPSYTSQCIRMKQANLEVVYMLLDTASAARVTKDCAAQGFTPKFMLLGLDATKEMPSIPSLGAALIPGATASPGATDLPGVQRYL
jgi:branched-chain amino acid transport system substrate-binding protein